MTDVGIDAQWYHTHGYVHVPGVFTPSEVEAMREGVRDTPKGEAWRGEWLGKHDRADLRAKHGIHTHSAFAAACAKPSLLAVLRVLMRGKTPSIHHSTVVIKPPETGQPFPMHQDAAYYANGTADYVLVTLVLDDFTDTNGPIRFLPGSHTRGLLPHSKEGKKHLPMDQYRIEDTEVVLAKAGDIVCFSLYTVHGSYPNTSSVERRTVRVGYQPA